jgi:hypothetical protein
LSGRCSAIKRNGERCRVSVGSGAEFCWAHDPTNAQARRRITSKAGKSKPNRDLADIKRRCTDLADGVLAGTVERARAAVAGQLLNTVIRAVGVELKVREQQDLIERLEELECLLDQQKGDSRFGA